MTSAAGSWCVTFSAIDTRKLAHISSLVLICLQFGITIHSLFSPPLLFLVFCNGLLLFTLRRNGSWRERASQKTQEKHSYSQATKWQECESWLRLLLLTFSHLKEDVFTNGFKTADTNEIIIHCRTWEYILLHSYSGKWKRHGKEHHFNQKIK